MSDFYTRIVSDVLFPLQERLKKHDTARVHRQMDASQWWPRERILALQLQRLQALLKYADAHVPYYRGLFAQTGFDPAKVRSVADLQSLPFLTKADIRANSDALRADNAVGLARFNTGGSSGEPLIFFIGTERVSHDVAAKWRATRWWDVDIGDREIVVWGSPIELGTQDRVRLIRDALMRTELLPAFEMSDEKVDGFIARIRERRPRMLFGYPSAISHIALRAEQRGVRLDDLGIKVVFCTSERLYDHQRETITRLFGCPVANGYGGRDAGFIAHECPSGNMHVTAEDIVVEIIDEAGRVLPHGQSGEIVVTHLATRDYPFIRYRTGDIGTLGDEACPCGRGLPILKDIQGRSTDFVVAEDGTVLHGLSLIYVVRDLTGVRAFKIVQESRSLTRVLLVPEAGANTAGMDAIVIEGFRRRLGAGVDVAVEFVESIPAEKSGKFRYVVSHVAVR
ncbi:phenylacetate--CoA ligase family protein [Thauera linaloolentis]|uniref:Capsular polysaccharide biosynthesis protein CapK n=1 Tax=Thauera linaloolentis (strain DSM 12138 / JCM 21573 / CCUG 41526 / CIP 105981 / IAM 15112 / NBRC 102519 / 47Lol) TaxID=1123367 RepID=N6Y8H3_THAL4|nr:AMP-binding protein [Thauera linaloolentis]ENO90596.1 capsular polysaccharide biosynthesis protein CapK [Thauera linaloolentis 47Lol = DSM 12138]MCM8566102.1 AMP-binding protein [Thauera linaloolentis]